MKKKIKNNYVLIEAHIISDFLPKPEDLILKEKHNINWRSPAEMDKFTLFD